MEDLKLLGTINGIYNLDKEAQETNIYTLLLVYTDKYESMLKLEYFETGYNILGGPNKDKHAQMNINKGEILLKDVGEMEAMLLVANFNESWCKEVIFNKYLDWRGYCLNYQKVY